jgi:hypothetical protein
LIELRTSLEEHQSALELIMSKYREQMFRLLMASKKDDPGIIMKLKEQHSKVILSTKLTWNENGVGEALVNLHSDFKQ